MGLGDLSGVFSRFFVVGFFAPALFTTAGIVGTVVGDFERGDIWFVAGAALFAALILSGLRSPIWLAFEGRVFGRMINTRFGAATTSYRTYVRERWRLDAWLAWPYFDSLLTERERELHADARSEAHFFLNCSLGGLALGATLVGSATRTDTAAGAALKLALAGASVAAAFALYRGAVGAAGRWGELKAAAIALHRSELYERLGFGSVSLAREPELAEQLNALLRDGTAVGSEHGRHRPSERG